MNGIIDRIITPSAELTDPGERRRARLLLSMLAMFVVFGLCVTPTMALATSGSWPLLPQAIFNIFGFSMMYAIARTRHYRVAAFLACLAPLGSSVAMGLMEPTRPDWVAFGSLGILLAAFFLDLQKTAIMSGVLMGVGAFVLWSGGDALPLDHQAGSFSFFALFGALVLITKAQNNALERERRADLVERERLQRLLLRASFEGIARHEGGRLGEVSARFARTVGRTREELHGSELARFVDPDHHARLAEAARLANGEPVELTIDGRDGPLQVELVALRIIQSNEASEWFAVRDISERMENEERLRRAQRMQAIGQLAGGVAHDFNNMLTVILAEAAYLQEELDGENRRGIDAILAAASQGSAVTRQLLTFARRTEPLPANIELDAAFERVGAMFTRLLPKNVTLDTAAEHGCVVTVDPVDLENALVNLVMNGADAMPDGGRLTIRAETTDDEVVIRVRDEGNGMDAETMERAFEPFYTTKQKGAGTGLGLALVRAFAENSGGRVDLESSSEGTELTIGLPHARAAATPTTSGRPARRATSRRVLLIEDQEAVRAALRKMLQSLGHTVVEASGVSDVTEAANADAPIDLVLSDVVLADGTGPEAVAALFTVHGVVPVVYMSGYSDGHLEAARVPLETERLTKPFTAAELAAALERVAIAELAS